MVGRRKAHFGKPSAPQYSQVNGRPADTRVSTVWSILPRTCNELELTCYERNPGPDSTLALYVRTANQRTACLGWVAKLCQTWQQKTSRSLCKSQSHCD